MLIRRQQQEGSEMTESPVIPPSLIRSYPYPQSSPAAAKLKEPDLDRWRSRVPATGNSPLVPKPLFSSAKCVVGIEMVAATSESPTSSASPPSPAAPTAADATPISPSPSLFPVPPSNNGVVASAVTIISSTTFQASNSVHSQSATGNTTATAAAAVARPRPVSSCYSQNTLTTVTATVASSPRTPVLPDWPPSLSAGLPNFDMPGAETRPDANMYAQIYTPAHMKQVVEEQPAPQNIPVQIQVPRLQSPSPPQDRGSRRRTAPNPISAVSHGTGRGSFGGWSLGRSSERTIYPEMSTVSMDYEGSNWPLQKPSTVHNTRQRHEVSRSRVSNVSTPEPHSHHVANKSSFSSTLTSTLDYSEPHRPAPHPPPPPPPPDVASARTSVADSHTPIYGRGEQRSGWWSDDDDVVVVGESRGGNIRRAATGIKEKLSTEGRGLRERWIKIIAGASILGILIIVGVAVGVTLAMRRSN